MSDTRNVYVNLSLQVAGYISNSQKVREANKATMTDAQKMKATIEAQQQAFEKTGRVLLTVGALTTAAFAAMIKASADFEQRMSQVQALSKATAPQMEKLRDSAFSAGRAFGLSATQVADAQIELVRAGVAVKDIIGGALPGALALAAAGQLDVGKATAIATTAMTQFKLQGADVPHVADLLAAGADKSIASVESLGDSLAQSGQVSAQFGLSVEDTVGTLTAFSKAGLNGSDAGTSLKTTLTQLAKPTKEAQALLDKYNITTYDTEGRFVGITGLAENLRKGLGGLSQEQRNAALSTIFGNDAIRASGVLYDLGGKKLQGFIDRNNEAGFAALQASKKLDNLNGDLQKLASTFQDDLVKSGSAGNNALRGIAKSATSALTIFGDMFPSVQAAGLALTGAAAAATLTGGAFLVLVPKVTAAKAAMKDLNLTGKGLAGTFGKGAALTIGISALAGGFANLGARGEVNSQQLARAAERIKGSYKDIDKAFPSAGVFDFGGGTAKASLDMLTSLGGKANQVAANFLDGATATLTFGVAGSHLGDVFKSNEETFDALGQQLGAFAKQDYRGASDSFNRLVTQMGGGVETAKQLISPEVMPAYREELVALAKMAGVSASEQNLLDIAQRKGAAGTKVLAAQQELAAAASQQQASAINVLAGAANDGTSSIKDLQDAIDGLDRGQLDTRAATRAFEAAIDDATAAVKSNGRTLDVHTEKGRANQEKLDALAVSSKALAKAKLAETGNQNDATKVIQNGRAEYVKAAIAMNLSRKKAEELATAIFDIPTPPRLDIKLSNDKALARIRDTIKRLRDIDGTIANVYINAVNNSKVPTKVSSGLIATGRAEGGPIVGSGPKGVDSVLIAAAPNEHMITSQEVDAVGGHFAVERIRASMRAGTLRGYAKGGAIGDAQSTYLRYESKLVSSMSDIEHEKINVRELRRRLRAAQTTAEKASDESSSIYGKGTGDEKHAAAQKARELAKRVKTVQASLDAAEKRLDAARKKTEKFQSAQDDAQSKKQSLTQAGQDFTSAERRGGSDALGYIDQLRSMSRDENYSAARRRGFKQQADLLEQSVVDLAKASEDAAKRVDTAKQSLDEFTASSQQMASSITSTIANEYRASSAYTTTEDRTVTRQAGNLTYSQVVKGGSSITAAGIAGYYSGGASTAKAFAAQLQQLASRGVNAGLLAEIAGYGVSAGAPIAAALLSASTSELSSINNDYASIQSSAGAAGQTVADANFKTLIETAQAQLDAENANAKSLTDAIAAQADRLERVIGKALGLPGYASGTLLTPGNRTQIAGFVHGQETVVPADRASAFRSELATMLNEKDATRARRTLYAQLGASGASSRGSATLIAAAPVRVQVSFADSALRSMVQVEVAQADQNRAIELEVL